MTLNEKYKWLIICNHSLIELKEKKIFSQPVRAIQRGNDVLLSPEKTVVIEKDDVLIVMAKPEELACKTCAFEPEDTALINSSAK